MDRFQKQELSSDDNSTTIAIGSGVRKLFGIVGTFIVGVLLGKDLHSANSNHKHNQKK